LLHTVGQCIRFFVKYDYVQCGMVFQILGGTVSADNQQAEVCSGRSQLNMAMDDSSVCRQSVSRKPCLGKYVSIWSCMSFLSILFDLQLILGDRTDRMHCVVLFVSNEKNF